MKKSDVSVLLLFGLIMFGFFFIMKPYKQEPAVNDKNPDQRGALFEVPEFDTIQSDKVEFRSYSPLVDHQKNHVKFKR